MAHDHDDGGSTEGGCSCQRRLSRRGFLASIGTGTVAAAAGAPLLARSGPRASPAAAVAEASDTIATTLVVNGHRHRLLVEPRWSLLHVLREHLGLTAAKMGCERGECGACTVLVDDVPRYACMTLAVEAEGAAITTLEGLLRGGELGPVQQAFLELDAYQCGYCTPGQIMAVEGLLRRTARPDVEEIRTGVSGNLCRCGAYAHIVAAAGRAAELRRQGGERP
ncbi:MAG: (2Fe-2S)-binding protein [Candidatus Eiseniibacteriota bacterium]|jgi:xanthine dehydrogenase YagT iron-sulfur-binding subunit